MEECSGGAEGADALIGGDAGARSGGAARADSHSGPMSHARNASSAQLQIRYYSGNLLRPSLQTQMAPGAQVIIKALPPRL